ncbi:class I SAM-dependent methyltransferase [Desulfobacter postgatei]|jgi:ubiquinone/menaquinone biosynthesis C-methylase UbiE|uniref:class I SAM-dependent methyltransferase n=1 Tax=Desulfobacter postgatei TaxID=2293 RepID=UPI002A367D18|nr:class I SAM-dependent methyltransferase [Desulfobacter postgatei]MDX9964980.1 class I SAM-dependent methyltransferase [Desulfobacter postgatei]
MKDNSDKIIADKIVQFTSLSNKNVLEIGCGNGRITSFLVNKAKKLIAIEPDFTKIREAKENIPGVAFQIASGENLPLSNASFDLVIFTLSLHHQNSESALAEAIRVLKAEGEILIIEPTVEGEVQRVFSLVSSENQELINAQRAIKDSGLEIHNSEVFNATWSFENKKDLCQSTFNFYNGKRLANPIYKSLACHEKMSHLLISGGSSYVKSKQEKPKAHPILEAPY